MRRDNGRFLRLGIGGTGVLLAVALGVLIANVSSGASPKARGDVLTVTFADKGSTLHLHVGQTIRVVLDNTYWATRAPSSSNPDVLAQRGSATILPRLAGCVAGQGCGNVIVQFRATATGTTKISSSRVSCGEALRCTGGNGSFYVTVNVA